MRDYEILRALGNQLAEAASLEVQSEKRNMWKQLNSLKKVRPMVIIDQLPWNELNKSDEMQLKCKDEFLRKIEWDIKSLLYRWKHFPVDMVIEKRIDIPMSISGLKYGVNVVEETLGNNDGSTIVSHSFHDMLTNEEDLAKLSYDKITVDRELDARHMDICNDIFNGIIPVRLKGADMHMGLWDRIAQMKPVDKILWDIIDRPDFVKKIVKKFVDINMNVVDQCEELGILDAQSQYVHCTGAYNDELPSNDYDAQKPMAKDCWAFGMAQVFSTVSPAMHNEFEIEMVKPLYERFGLMYYGCCEPLENVIEHIKQIKNVRKISCSPWANASLSAERIGKDYVYSSKPNPAFLAMGQLDEDAVLGQIQQVIKECDANDTPCELILKDLSTVSNKLNVLDKWADIVMNVVEK